jgi:hypothetical protein
MRSALIIGSAVALGACNISADAQESEGAGGTGRRDFQVASFDRVSLAGSHNVIVTVGGQPSVRAEGDAKQLERLDIRVEDGELKIGTRKTSGISFRRESKSVTIHVTVPSLSAASLAGSGDLRIDKVEGDRFAAAIAGSGDIEIGAMRVAAADFKIGGSGGIRATGAAQNSNISVAGSGSLELGALETRRTKVSLAGSGDVHARATEAADVSIMGSGDVTMAGPAKCNVSKMGSGDVHCGG